MKISVDDKELFTLSETQKKVIKNDIDSDIFEDEMKRRLNWVLNHKYEQCFARLKTEWDQKLSGLGVSSIPTDPDAYAETVFALPQYKDRKSREAVKSIKG